MVSSQPTTNDDERLPLTLHYSQAQLLTRGWTKSMIDELLGPPEFVDRRLGEQRFCFAPNRVHAVESSDDFLERKQHARLQRSAMQGAVSKRRAALMTAVSEVGLSVPAMKVSELSRLAIAAYNRTAARRRVTTMSDRVFIAYITVHWLCRQNLVYTTAVAETKGKVGHWEAYRSLRTRLLNAIAKTYPHLAEECAVQRRELTDKDGLDRRTLEFLETSPPNPDELGWRYARKSQAMRDARPVEPEGSHESLPR